MFIMCRLLLSMFVCCFWHQKAVMTCDNSLQCAGRSCRCLYVVFSIKRFFTWIKRRRKIKISLNVFVFTDKINNIYKSSKYHHKKFLHDNVTITYQKTPPILGASTNLEAKIISTKLSQTHCKNTCFCGTQRPQRQLSFQSNVP